MSPFRIQDPYPSRIRTRSVEMYLATVMAVMGAIFVIPGQTMNRPAYHDLQRWVSVFPGSELTFGFLLFVLGLARFLAIVANGSWKPGDWYPSPLIRLIGCCVGSFFWTSLTLSFLFSPVEATPGALAWTIPAVIYELFAAVMAAVDAHLYDSFGIRRRASVRAKRG